MIEGALFDGSRLVECNRDSPAGSAIAPCTVAWVVEEETKKQPADTVQVRLLGLTVVARVARVY